MAKARALYLNLAWDAATTVAASTEATGYAATNTLARKRGLPWRSATGTGSQDITYTFSGSKTVLAVVAGNYKIHTGGTLKAQYWNGSSYVDLATFTVPASNRTKVIVVFVNQSTSRIRYLFTNTGAVNEYVELAIPFIVDASGYFQTTVNYADGINWVPNDPSITRSTVGGQEQSRVLPAYLQFTAQFKGIPASEDVSWLALRDYVGAHLPWVLALDPGDPDKIVYGKLAAQFPRRGVPFSRWDVDLAFREMV